MKWEEHIDTKWITTSIGDKTIDWTDRFAKHLVNQDDGHKLTTSQLRKFFGKLKQIEADYENQKNQIPMLKPKLAYAVGRSKGNTKIKDFYHEMEIALSNVDPSNKSTFKNFVSLIESIVAYHKYHGGE